VFEKPPLSPQARARSKDSILQEVDSLRALARRARRLASTVTDDEDQRNLGQYIKELEGNAARLEKAAIDAKSG